MPESILNLLKNRDAFVSGQEISTGLGITRQQSGKKFPDCAKKAL